MKKSNGIISIVDVDFILRETDYPYDDNDNNNENLDNNRNKIYFNRRKLNFKGKGRMFDSSNVSSFLFIILFKLKLASTPIFKFSLENS